MTDIRAPPQAFAAVAVTTKRFCSNDIVALGAYFASETPLPAPAPMTEAKADDGKNVAAGVSESAATPNFPAPWIVRLDASWIKQGALRREPGAGAPRHRSVDCGGGPGGREREGHRRGHECACHWRSGRSDSSSRASPDRSSRSSTSSSATSGLSRTSASSTTSATSIRRGRACRRRATPSQAPPSAFVGAYYTPQARRRCGPPTRRPRRASRSRPRSPAPRSPEQAQVTYKVKSSR